MAALLVRGMVMVMVWALGSGDYDIYVMMVVVSAPCRCAVQRLPSQ
jgi:hypothetical protein